MKFSSVIFMLVVVLLVSGSVFATADGGVAITNEVAPREVRDYKVDVVIKGKMPVEGVSAVDLDTQMSFHIKHKYGVRDRDGVIPLEITLTDGEMVAAGQKIAITPGMYPKLTVLLDREWKVKEVFGLTRTHDSEQLPGVNYSNLIAFFYLHGVDEALKTGDSWKSVVALPGYGATYDVTSKIEALKQVDEVQAVVVSQEIAPVADEDTTPDTASMSANAVSTFAVDSGKLLKSHIDCAVVFNGTSGSPDEPLRTTIGVDISLLK